MKSLSVQTQSVELVREYRPPLFLEVYQEHFAFVWRSLRRLGVPPSALDDAAQDVFLVVHARLPSFEGRSTLRTWLFSIVRKVARDHRPTLKERSVERISLSDIPLSHDGNDPQKQAETAERAALLHALLDTLDDEKREAFVLAEIEQMTVPEVAEALGVNLNTVYSRVRAARRELEQALVRYRARVPWSER